MNHVTDHSTWIRMCTDPSAQSVVSKIAHLTLSVQLFRSASLPRIKYLLLPMTGMRLVEDCHQCRRLTYMSLSILRR